jgi:excisionase family DNA binding protein
VTVMAEHRSGGASDGDRSPKTQSGEGGRWLSIAQAAARVSVSTRTIKRWIGAGDLPAARSPSPKGKGHLRVRLGDLEAVLARGTVR